MLNRVLQLCGKQFLNGSQRCGGSALEIGASQSADKGNYTSWREELWHCETYRGGLDNHKWNT